jgi:hypothetical protein
MLLAITHRMLLSLSSRLQVDTSSLFTLYKCYACAMHIIFKCSQPPSFSFACHQSDTVEQ